MGAWASGPAARYPARPRADARAPSPPRHEAIAARFWRAIRSDRRGVVLVELAIAIPLLVALLLGGVEVGRYLLLNQKLDSAAAELADLIAREETLSAAQLDGLFAAVGNVVAPFAFDARGLAIVSGVAAPAPGAPARVLWQALGAGTLDAASEIGAPGAAALIPAGLARRDEQTVVVAEIFYAYTPILSALLPAITLHKTAFFRPRLGLLDSLE